MFYSHFNHANDKQDIAEITPDFASPLCFASECHGENSLALRDIAEIDTGVKAAP